MVERELVFTAYPVQATFLSGQVFVGPGVLDGVFSMGAPIPNAGIWTLYDGRNNAARIIMRGIGTGLVTPFQFPEIRIRLESGLFFEQDAVCATGWTFVIAKAP